MLWDQLTPKWKSRRINLSVNPNIGVNELIFVSSVFLMTQWGCVCGEDFTKGSLGESRVLPDGSTGVLFDRKHSWTRL